MLKSSKAKVLPTPLEVVDYNFKNPVIRLGQYGRTSLNLKPDQDIYIYEDLDNMQLVLCVYELKRSMYHSIICFSDIEYFKKLGVELSRQRINILSINFYKRDGKYRATLLYEVPDHIRSKWEKNSLETILKKIPENDTEDKIKVLDTIEYSEDEKKDEGVKHIVVPLIQYQDIFKKSLKSVKISKNWTIYYKISDDFKERANLKGADACKCIQIVELDVGMLILKFYETNIFRINIETLNLPGSFVRLINICKHLNIEIEAIDLQKISLEEAGSAEIIYILKFPDEIKNNVDNIKIKELFDEADTVLKEEDPEHGEIVKKHDKILERTAKKDKSSFIHKIEIL